jgi:hypothetical protein
MDHLDSAAPTRIVIYACVTDIPGDASRRPWTLGNLFCNAILHRDLNAKLHVSGFDSMHIPHGFDSERPTKRWFIYDLNVVRTLDKDELLKIPHLVYLASWQHGH